jgi:hypothetical protein
MGQNKNNFLLQKTNSLCVDWTPLLNGPKGLLVGNAIIWKAQFATLGPNYQLA